jgi:hypothetical protein
MWADVPDKLKLFFDAASQGQQLADAALVWPTIDPTVAARKLKIILGGEALPPKDPAVEDGPRNTLFEFATARALQVKGFNVSLSAQEEDVIAAYDGLGTFAVECKSPTSPRSLPNNVKKVRRQLRERCLTGDRLGFAVLGIERLLGLGGTTPNTPTLAGLESAVSRTLRAEVQRVRSAERETGKLFFPTTPLCGVLLTTVVFTEDRGGIFTVSQMGLFLTGPGDAPLSKRVYDALSQTIVTA